MTTTQRTKLTALAAAADQAARDEETALHEMQRAPSRSARHLYVACCAAHTAAADALFAAMGSL